ncbi:hypothetical protein D779_3784 [Imhoffiella purpurea]|uniref:Inner membrane protein YgaP-like transmembrane domain-containing protein n=2 Tax=Imhoffiella purpurea TaxID=1249627 RepID=W9V1Q1_9GAMM|nr:hypothetical protein D779_3784 [Imhoffiella purpurea]
MKKNMGDKDRMYRAIAGVLILLWGVSNANALGLIGFVVLATAYFRFCPVYIPMDIDTTR